VPVNGFDSRKFTRERHGYSPQEVDGVIAELERQIADYKRQLQAINNSTGQYEARVKQLEEERIKESLRLTGLMNAAGKMAEQIEEDAKRTVIEIIASAKQENAKLAAAIRQEETRIIGSAKPQAASLTAAAEQEAEQLRRQAQGDFASIREGLIKLSEIMQAIRQNNGQYMTDANNRISNIDSVLNQALSVIPVMAAVVPASAPPAVPQEQADADPYAEYVKNMVASEHQPSYRPRNAPDNGLFRGDGQ